MKPISDQELVRMLRSKDAAENDAGLKAIYAEHYPFILNYVKRNKGDNEEAADLFQDSIIVLYNNLRYNHLELTCAIRTYLYSVAKNLWLKKLRKRGRETTVDSFEERVEIGADQMSYLLSSEKSSYILKLIASLGEQCRQILTYFYYDQKQMVDIALLMEFGSDQVAKNKKHKCMKKLKEKILNSTTYRQFFDS